MDQIFQFVHIVWHVPAICMKQVLQTGVGLLRFLLVG